MDLDFWLFGYAKGPQQSIYHIHDLAKITNSAYQNPLCMPNLCVTTVQRKGYLCAAFHECLKKSWRALFGSIVCNLKWENWNLKLTPKKPGSIKNDIWLDAAKKKKKKKYIYILSTKKKMSDNKTTWPPKIKVSITQSIFKLEAPDFAW